MFCHVNRYAMFALNFFSSPKQALRSYVGSRWSNPLSGNIVNGILMYATNSAYVKNTLLL